MIGSPSWLQSTADWRRWPVFQVPAMLPPANTRRRAKTWRSAQYPNASTTCGEARRRASMSFRESHLACVGRHINASSSSMTERTQLWRGSVGASRDGGVEGSFSCAQQRYASSMVSDNKMVGQSKRSTKACGTPGASPAVPSARTPRLRWGKSLGQLA